MADLFSWFQSYLNLSKLTAITVPGMIVSFALILVFGPIPCSDTKDCPFCPSSLKPATPATKADSGKVAQGAGAGQPAQVAGAGNAAKDSGAVDGYVSVSVATLGTEKGIDAANNQIDTYNGLVKPGSALAKLPTTGFTSNPPSKSPSCIDTPIFIPSTKATQFLSAKDKTDADKAAAKKGQRLESLTTELDVLGQCSNSLQDLEAKIGVQSATLTQLATQFGSDLTSLSANYINARQQGERLVQNDIEGQVRDKKNELAKVQQAQTALTTVKSTVDATYKSVQGMIASLNTAPADTPVATPNAAADVFQTIEQNLLKFLLFSLIVGQILDPIQRGAVSFVGPRRNFFRSLNLVYGQSGDGEFRYGERRLYPWVEDMGDIVDLSPDNAAELRPNDAGRKFGEGPNLRPSSTRAFEMRDRNIYDKNYAVGAGFITAKEAGAIEDEYYGQSQITSGLILPMLFLSVCIAIRMICCSTPTAAQNTPATPSYVAGNIFLTFSTISFGVVLGTALMLLLLMLSSQRYWTAFAAGGRKFVKHARGLRLSTLFKQGERYTQDDSSMTVLRFWFFIAIAITFAICWAFAVRLMLESSEPTNGLHNHLSWLDLLTVLAPTLLAGPLWVAGLDRLHKYYSELNARIAGNILRLDTNTEQKMVDLITDPAATAKLKESIANSLKNKETIDRFFSQEKPPGSGDGEA
jgi:hypothetical protein